MANRPKPRRVATADRLDIRIMLDPHMGVIYARMAALPRRVRGRELLALARIAVGANGTTQQAAASPAARLEPQRFDGGPSELAPEMEGRHLSALAGFADAIPPAH